ncbi:MAG: membrane protein insertion efficiency factor YidD [Bacilli bacterium]|nr:membrane protein insertion efficiency factor YidD [Bacilli bacterium]
MKHLIIMLIRGYQIMPLSSHSKCRFTPTCSEYMIGALEEHGLFKGLKLGIKRVLRCHPHGKYGYDPVPKKER